MKKIATVAVFAAVLAAGGYVYAQTDNMAGMDHSGMNMGTDGMTMMSHAAMIPPELVDNAAVKGYAAAMDAMMTNMAPYTGDADVDFVKGCGNPAMSISMRLRNASGLTASLP